MPQLQSLAMPALLFSPKAFTDLVGRYSNLSMTIIIESSCCLHHKPPLTQFLQPRLPNFSTKTLTQFENSTALQLDPIWRPDYPTHLTQQPVPSDLPT